MSKSRYYSVRPEYLNLGILLLRLIVAGFLLTHGWPKLNRLLAGGEIRFGDPIGIGPTLSLVLSTFAEFLCSILVGIGLWTRLATIPVIINMSVVAFVSHSTAPFGRKELALLYLLIYVFLLISGGGKYTVDRLIKRKPK